MPEIAPIRVGRDLPTVNTSIEKAGPQPADTNPERTHAMYSNLSSDLARAKLDDRLAQAEAYRLAAAAKRARPRGQRVRIPAVFRLLPLRLMTRRPAT
jgi:hypothetical protein